MYGSHDMRHIGFPQVDGDQRDPREMGRHNDTLNPEVLLTTRLPVEFLWISDDSIPHCCVQFIGIHIFLKISRVSFVRGALPNIQPV